MNSICHIDQQRALSARIFIIDCATAAPSNKFHARRRGGAAWPALRAPCAGCDPPLHRIASECSRTRDKVPGISRESVTRGAEQEVVQRTLRLIADASIGYRPFSGEVHAQDRHGSPCINHFYWSDRRRRASISCGWLCCVLASKAAPRSQWSHGTDAR